MVKELVHQVIREEPGAGTGDRIVQTSDGTWWKTVTHFSWGTGDRQGILSDDKVFET